MWVKVKDSFPRWMRANHRDHDRMRSEYRREDLGEGVRGKHLAEYREGAKFVSSLSEDSESAPNPTPTDKTNKLDQKEDSSHPKK
jgi:hypothetical protein